jgi:hypothetical protein
MPLPYMPLQRAKDSLPTIVHQSIIKQPDQVKHPDISMTRMGRKPVIYFPQIKRDCLRGPIARTGLGWNLWSRI